MLRDVAKSRREVDLHWRTCGHQNIVNLKDVYENTYHGHKSILVVMEWCGVLFCLIICLFVFKVCFRSRFLVIKYKNGRG